MESNSLHEKCPDPLLPASQGVVGLVYQVVQWSYGRRFLLFMKRSNRSASWSTSGSAKVTSLSGSLPLPGSVMRIGYRCAKVTKS